MHESSLTVSASADTPAARTVSFLEKVFPAPRRFAIRLWDGTTLPSHGPPRFTLVLNAADSLRRMFRPPIEMSMGEGYLRRDFDIDGDLASAFDLVPAVREALSTPAAVGALLVAWLGLPAAGQGAGTRIHPAARLEGSRENRERARSAIQYHYDVGNDFYQLFLDRRMVYSCAYFPRGDEDLDAAQEAKLEHICRKLQLRPGETLLDIGCGWGGLLVYAAERYGVSGTGITLSAAQLELARERIAAAGLQDRVRVEQRDYRDVGGEQFDKVVSIGMFEHVGRAGLPGYFAQAHRLLRPGGLFLNHGISERASAPRPRFDLGRALEELVVGRYAFRNRYIFPDGELIPVSEVNLQAERAGFEVRDVENLREHYARTLRCWLERLQRRRDEAVRIAGEPVYRLWELYLAVSTYHFDTARININQTLLARPLENGRVPLPPSRAHLYA